MRARAGARLLWALLLAAPLSVAAHPMGNFSISHYAAIQLEPAGIRVHYLVDLAEIPTFQTLQDAGLRPDLDDPAVRAYAARAGATLAEGLRVELDGRRLGLHVESTDVSFPPGAGGLPTLRLGAVYRAARPDETGSARPGHDADAFDNLLWALIRREGPLTKAALLAKARLTSDVAEAALGRLLADGRIEETSIEATSGYGAKSIIIPLGARAGWEAAIYDHFRALVKTIVRKLHEDTDGAAPSDRSIARSR